MKSLSEYMMNLMESRVDKPSNWDDIITIKGKLKWKFKSDEYGIDDISIDCDGWKAGFGDAGFDNILLFWSPKSEWMPYVFLDEIRKGRINWALYDMACEPDEVPSKVLANFMGFGETCVNVPDLDYISIPKEVEKIVNDLKNDLKK